MNAEKLYSSYNKQNNNVLPTIFLLYCQTQVLHFLSLLLTHTAHKDLQLFS